MEDCRRTGNGTRGGVSSGIVTVCSDRCSDAGFGAARVVLVPTGRNREGQALSSKRSIAICFSSRSRPSLHHLA